MNNQARVCELKCIYNIQGICYAYGECIAKELFISELEKIREEIMKYSAENKNSKDLYLAGCGDGAYHSLAIIDKHIFELKGE